MSENADLLGLNEIEREIDTVALKTGIGAVQESIQRAKERQQQSNSRSANYFRWKDGDKKILRFLTDDVVTADFYEYVIGADGKPHDFLYSPDVFDGAEDFVLKYGGKQHESGLSGPLVAPKTIERTVGLAVLRKEVSSPKGSQVVDDIYDQEVGDKKLKSRWFGIVKQSQGNFWYSLINGYASRYGTICDRDYEITRDGAGLDTKYSIVPLDPDPDLKEIEALQKHYGYGKPWNNEDLKRFMNCPQTLLQWAESYAGEERVKYFLGSKEPDVPHDNGFAEFHKDTTFNPGDADEAQAGGLDFGDLRSRMEKYKRDQ